MRTVASIFEENGRRGPSFDMIRLFAAFMVMVSHAYLTTGTSAFWVHEIGDGQFSIGGLAVAIFFVLSGYVIMESFRRDPHPWRFARKRALRIYPALVAVVVLTALVVGPLMTTLPVGTYFSEPLTAAYLLHAIVPLWEHLPGVFTGNPAHYVNGSLWTIRWELGCYVLVALFGAGFVTRRNLVLGLTVAAVLASGVVTTLPRLHIHGAAIAEARTIVAGLPLVACFLGGCTVSLFAEKLPVSWPVIALATAVLVFSCVAFGFYFVFPLLGAYLVVVLGNLRILEFARLRRGIFAGDFSYGVYIVAFPVQQIVRQLLGGACTWWVSLLISLPVTLGLAMLSWHFIEKPCLRLKYAGADPIPRAA